MMTVPADAFKSVTLHPDQFAVAASGHQRAANEITERALAGVDEPDAFGGGEILK
jgi:hypothetical protein